MAEAVELVGEQRVPNEEEKKRAHDDIEEFATRQLPEAFYYRSTAPGGWMEYGMWPQKLQPETWKLLQDLQLAGHPLANSDYPLQDAAGLSIMSILADCCAGTTRARLTDRSHAYATLTNLLVDEAATDAQEAKHDRVIPLTLRLIQTADLPLETLIDFRRREAKSKGHDIRDLRHRYVDRLSKHVEDVRNLKHKSDRVELERQFENEMKDDLAHLKDELRIANREVLFSKEILVTAIAAAGSLYAATKGIPFDVPSAMTIAGAPVTAGGLLATHNKFTATRKAIMKKHPMAYLHELNRTR
ncbi:hypothetical protein [Microvirga splendida]|uniref:Uncharacterized protein n=1 Tax=Microvirga splendida TaxID=2795727 RepID=A0ABS0Y4K2_9HYPH|nr:hypothetical protein [Microvirga splendida]MBJ6127204.1 hypothetical protein [Microvirga splendida]